MQDMTSRRARPPADSAAAIRAATDKPTAPIKRVYTAEYKQAILRELDQLRVSGERGALGALLRREGLTWPMVNRWVARRDQGEAAALSPKKVGRPATRDPISDELARLRRQNEKLQRELRTAEIIIDVQKKLSLLLGVELPTDPDPNKGETS